MATLEQQRARLAFEHVEEVGRSDKAAQKKYASIVHAAPALLRSAGLSQALHFVASRSDESQRLYLDHLAAQLARVDARVASPEALLDRVRTAPVADYL